MLRGFTSDREVMMVLKIDKVKRNARTIGSLLRNARTANGFTQKYVADQLGIGYYTFISQVELGQATLPPTLWVPWSRLLGLDTAEFVASCMMHLQPELYEAQFGRTPKDEVSEALRDFTTRH